MRIVRNHEGVRAAAVSRRRRRTPWPGRRCAGPRLAMAMGCRSCTLEPGRHPMDPALAARARLVVRFAPNAPQAVRNEAVIRCSGGRLLARCACAIRGHPRLPPRTVRRGTGRRLCRTPGGTARGARLRTRPESPALRTPCAGSLRADLLSRRISPPGSARETGGARSRRDLPRADEYRGAPGTVVAGGHGAGRVTHTKQSPEEPGRFRDAAGVPLSGQVRFRFLPTSDDIHNGRAGLICILVAVKHGLETEF